MKRPAPLCDVCGLPNRSRPLRAHTGSWRCRNAVEEARFLAEGFVSLGYLGPSRQVAVRRPLGPARVEAWTRAGPRFVQHEDAFCGGGASHPGPERVLWVKHWLAVLLLSYAWDLSRVPEGVFSVLFQDSRLAAELGHVYALGHLNAALALVEGVLVPLAKRGLRG